jgi:hypothetical protein
MRRLPENLNTVLVGDLRLGREERILARDRR